MNPRIRNKSCAFRLIDGHIGMGQEIRPISGKCTADVLTEIDEEASKLTLETKF
jgi:hypothetical protein